MPLFAILTDDKSSIREIRDFPADTVFKPGYAFPVTVEAQPSFNQDTQMLQRVAAMPVNGIVVVSWNVVSRPQEELDAKTRLDSFKQLFQDGRAIESNWATATNAQKLELGRINFRILWMARTSLAELIKPEAS